MGTDILPFVGGDPAEVAVLQTRLQISDALADNDLLPAADINLFFHDN